MSDEQSMQEVFTRKNGRSNNFKDKNVRGMSWIIANLCTKKGLLQHIGNNKGGRVTQDKGVYKSILKVAESGQKGLTSYKPLPEKSSNFL